MTRARTLALGFALGVAATAGVVVVGLPSTPLTPATANASSGGPTPPVAAATVAPDLLPDEQNTVSVFQAQAKSVVYVQNIGLRRDMFTLNTFQTPQGSGSGFVWDTDGHVVTNYHVVQDASALTVTLQDGNTYDATVVGVDPSKDLAVVQITAPAGALSPVEPGSSSALLVGQKVLAIGNPFGLDQTLTVGVISALGREIQAVNGRTISNVIQTDAAINPGNSGGPLLDAHGRLIGVNAQIYSPSGASAGIGFAIPVDTVERIVPELISHGKVTQPGFGTSFINDGIARQFGIQGVAIAAVDDGSSAATAGLLGLQRDARGGLELGNVIAAIDAKKVDTTDALLTILEGHAVGDVVTVTVRRGKETRDVKVTLQAAGAE